MSTGPRQLDKYELRVRLGRGGMAEVWKAFDTQLHRYVAIKILHADLQNDPSFISRFEREAQLIASLHHPNIVQIFDFHVSRPAETEETVAYMVMDYVEGTTLSHYLRNTSRDGKFPLPVDIVNLFTPICLAVDYAHQKGMIHRDLKPANILLDRRTHSSNKIGEPILSDFGIAKLLGSTANTHSGWWLGTPYYTSPEQVKGAAGDERSDIYALGVILYEMCVGTLPFQGDNPTAIIMQQINADPIPPALINPDVSPMLAAVILRGLSKVPADRFPNASSMGIALAEALHTPVPASLRQSSYDMDELNNATFINPVRSETPAKLSAPSITPAFPQQGMGLSTPVSKTPSNWTPPPITPTPDNITHSRPTRKPETSGMYMPYSTLPVGPTDADSGPHPEAKGKPAPSVPSTPILTADSSPRTSPNKDSIPALHKTRQSHRIRTIITLLMLLLLLAASVGTLFLLTHRTSTSVTNQTVGNAFFINSGQLNPDNSQGINDEILLDLHNLSDPPGGKSYYAWLLPDRMQNEQEAVQLGQLHIDHGNVHMSYKGNTLYTNMLATRSRILVTQEDASIQPSTYSPDYSNWIYYAQLSQAVSSKDKLHYSMLDHLRHLLSESPELKIRGLHGGLDIWFLRNTQKILEWSNAARDEWHNDSTLLHRQLIRILDYIDGKDFVQKDAPAVGTTMYANPHDSQVALLGHQPDGQDPPGYTFDNETPPGYVYLMSSHLAGTVLSPDATADQRALASHIQVAIDQTKNWIEQAHQDAKQLLTMNADQLAQPAALSLLDNMVVNTQYAYVGQTDPLTGQLQGGASWVCSNIQRLANFELKPFNLQGYRP